MIKMICDKCGKEIKDKYYKMNFTECYTNSISRADSVTKLVGSISTIDTYVVPTELEKLNSEKVYCDKCRKEIEKMDFSNYINTDIKNLIEELKKDDKFEKLIKDMVKL